MTDQKEDKQWQIIRDLKKEIRELEAEKGVDLKGKEGAINQELIREDGKGFS